MTVEPVEPREMSISALVALKLKSSASGCESTSSARRTARSGSKGRILGDLLQPGADTGGPHMALDENALRSADDAALTVGRDQLLADQVPGAIQLLTALRVRDVLVMRIAWRHQEAEGAGATRLGSGGRC